MTIPFLAYLIYLAVIVSHCTGLANRSDIILLGR